MARDPDTFRVSPSLTQLPMMAAPAVQDAGPEQLAQAGQAITNAGRVASSLYEDMLKEQNATRVTEALTQLTERRNEMSVNALSQTGKNALERPSGKALDEEVGGEFDSTISELEQSLGNDAQRQMFRERAQGMAVEFRGRVQAHVVEQDRVYKLETYAGMADTFSTQLANARDEGEIGEAINGITTAANNIFAIKGTPEAGRGGVLAKLLTPGHTAQLTRMIEAEQIDGAEAYLNKYREQIEPDVASKLEGALVQQRLIIAGNDLGEAIASKHIGTADIAEPAQPGIKIEGFAGTGLPVLGTITNTFGQHQNRGSAGLDIAAAEGTAIRLPYGGRVVERGFNSRAGNYVIVDHGGGVVTSYSHLKGPAKVAKGGAFAAGTVVGEVGSTGNSTGPHLHYRVKVNGADVDPQAFHNGKAPPPQSTATGGVVGRGQGTLQSALEDLYSQNLPRQAEEAAERRIRSLHGAQRDAENENKEAVRNRAFAEVDKTGRLSDATRASLVGAGMADLIPSLRSFESATQERRSGKPVGEQDSLEAYGKATIAIADGKIYDIDHLLKYKPLLSESHLKQLMDKLASSPRTAQARANETIAETKALVGTTHFLGDDDKFNAKAYTRFIGAVTGTIEEREAREKRPLTREERREIVLGLIAVDKIDGEKKYNYDIYQRRAAIPPRARLETVRALRRNGITNPSMADVVNVWEMLSDKERKAYNKTR